MSSLQIAELSRKLEDLDYKMDVVEKNFAQLYTDIEDHIEHSFEYYYDFTENLITFEGIESKVRAKSWLRMIERERDKGRWTGSFTL